MKSERILDATETTPNGESQFRALFHASIDAILITDDSRRYVDANPAGCVLLGVARRELNQFRIDDFSPPERRALIEDAWQAFLRDGEQSGEYELVRPDGTIRTVAFSAKANFVPGRHLSSLRDITERREAENKLRQLSARVLTLQDEERRRLGRELHDSAGQHLAAAKMHLAMLRNPFAEALCDPRNMALFSGAMDSIERCINEIRTISYLVHPPLLDEMGLTSALRWYAEGFAQRSGIAVDLDIPETLGRLPQDLETAAFRIVQESLTNIHKHSKSPSAKIRLLLDAEAMTLEVIDQGVGLAKPSANGDSHRIGVGVAGMQDRVRQLDGQLQIDSGPGGTTVRAVFPLHHRGQ